MNGSSTKLRRISTPRHAGRIFLAIGMMGAGCSRENAVSAPEDGSDRATEPPDGATRTTEDSAVPQDDAALGESCSTPDTVSSKSIAAFVASLPHGTSYSPMTPAQMGAATRAAGALVLSDLTQARADAAAAGYGLVPLRAGGECYWLMQPTNAAAQGQATLVVATSWDRDLVIEAPHVPNDHDTDAEAAIVFTSVRARGLVVAGAQRCASTVPSGCHANYECASTGIAAKSDPAHSVDNALHAFHIGLVKSAVATTFLQLHTNGDAAENGDLRVSNGTPFAIAGTAADALYAALRAPGLDVRTCNDAAAPPDAKAFCGENNAQSLVSNGASDACIGWPPKTGGAAAHRFIHLEQSSKLLDAVESWAARVSSAVGTAIAPR